MAVILALLASLSWGASDFLGGTASRRLPATAVVAVSQGFALIGVAVVAAVVGAYDASPAYLGWAALAAVVGAIALGAFYQALAIGTMGVVAPVAATGVLVPVVVGLAGGDRPSTLQAVGVGIAVSGVILSSGPELRGGARRSLLLAATAAVGFGVVIVAVAHGARTSTPMTLLVMRASTVVMFGTLAAAGRVSVRVERRDWPLLAAIGAGDVGANALFALASTRGLLSVVSVLSSLYPAITVLLARLVHRERMTPIQDGGVVATLAGVALIAAG